MRRRKNQAFRPGTVRNHMVAIRAYFGFCFKFKLQALCPSTLTVCMFVEFLARTFTCAKSIKNYISAVRLLHKRLDIDAPGLYSFDLQLMLRALKISLGGPRQRLPITVDILHQLCATCDLIGSLGTVLKCVFLFAFFRFLRCSNLAPPSETAFDFHPHLSRGDIFIHDTQVVIMIKWSKTLQAHERFILLPLPSLPNHPLCPLTALRVILRSCPAPSTSPFFLLPGKHTTRLLTAPRLRHLLAQLLQALGLSPSL